MLNKQKGFTLVELMVAMAIGTVIILGAGQLFLTTFQTFKTVDELSRKQESLIFITEVMVKDIRAAIAIDEVRDDAAIHLSMPAQDGNCKEDDYFEKEYFLSKTNDNFSLSIRNKCGDESEWSNAEPLVEGFYDDSNESFVVEGLSGGFYKLTIRLATEKGQNYEEFVLRVQNRLNIFSSVAI